MIHRHSSCIFSYYSTLFDSRFKTLQQNHNPNTRRAVTEGLRIWTSRPYFKENPNEAIERIANLKEDASEYVRKSVGNALRDISKKFPELIKIELDSWKLESKEIKQVYKLASKLIV